MVRVYKKKGEEILSSVLKISADTNKGLLQNMTRIYGHEYSKNPHHFYIVYIFGRASHIRILQIDPEKYFLHRKHSCGN